jgi:hypothetical protein
MDRLPFLRTLLERTQGNGVLIDAAERTLLTTGVNAIVAGLFGPGFASRKSFTTAVRFYEAFLGAVSLALTGSVIGNDALYFVPEFPQTTDSAGEPIPAPDNGFNTDSLQKTGGPYNGLGSRLYFTLVVEPAYQAYVQAKKQNSEKPMSVDDWLQKTREDYAKSGVQPAD